MKENKDEYIYQFKTWMIKKLPLGSMKDKTYDIKLIC